MAARDEAIKAKAAYDYQQQQNHQAMIRRQQENETIQNQIYIDRVKGYQEKAKALALDESTLVQNETTVTQMITDQQVTDFILENEAGPHGS